MSGDDTACFQYLADALHQQGYVIVSDILAPNITNQLLNHIQALQPDDFQKAGIGRHLEHQVNQMIRSDKIYWLDPLQSESIAYLHWLEQLRCVLNRKLFLGLFDFEGHFACYSTGAFYKKHVDAFVDNRNRMVTVILYLNHQWREEDGGILQLYDKQGNILQSITPDFGKLVLFLSEEFPHEVTISLRPRYSVTGWFRINNTLYNTVDPSS